MVLAIKNMGGESEAAWRAVLDDLLARGVAKPELVIVDGGKGLEAALASLWDDVAIQRCTVHKERNVLAHAPKHLHDEIKAEFNDMMHASTAEDVLSKRKAFLAKWKLRCRAVADSLEEAGERLFTSCATRPIDKSFLLGGAMLMRHGRPRGEERGGGCGPRRAA